MAQCETLVETLGVHDLPDRDLMDHGVALVAWPWHA